MSRLIWDEPGERFYETGIDRGVLYLPEMPGVPWSGLVSMEEDPQGGEHEASYIDGYKYHNATTKEEFGGTLTAVNHPEEFYACDGVASLGMGLFAGQQRRISFGLSFRTLIKSDLDLTGEEYKIHIVYNAVAEAASRKHVTIDDTMSVENYSWVIRTKPIRLVGYAPIAHLIIDTRGIKDYTDEKLQQTFTKAEIIANVESHLYGDDAYNAMLPDPVQMQTILEGHMLERTLAS